MWPRGAEIDTSGCAFWIDHDAKRVVDHGGGLEFCRAPDGLAFRLTLRSNATCDWLLRECQANRLRCVSPSYTVQADHAEWHGDWPVRVHDRVKLRELSACEQSAIPRNHFVIADAAASSLADDVRSGRLRRALLALEADLASGRLISRGPEHRVQ